jgi:hypothetical protein
MKRTLLGGAVLGCMLAAGALESQASIFTTVGAWKASPVQTDGNMRWTLSVPDTTLPDSLAVYMDELTSAVKFQDTFGQVLYDSGPGANNSYLFHYSVELLDPSLVFTSVALDSTTSGHTLVTKDLRAFGDSSGATLISTLMSTDGAATGAVTIPGALSALDVQEGITVYPGVPGDPLQPNGLIRDFVNTYTVAAVPEPGTIFAGALLLLPFGVSTIRMLRRKRAA